MKKVSTAAAHLVEKVEGQKLTIGLDLGDRSSWYCVLNGAGEVLLERKLATTPKAMKEVFGAIPTNGIWKSTDFGETFNRIDRAPNAPPDQFLDLSGRGITVDPHRHGTVYFADQIGRKSVV